MYALRERRVHVTQEDFEMAVAKVQCAAKTLRGLVLTKVLFTSLPSWSNLLSMLFPPLLLSCLYPLPLCPFFPPPLPPPLYRPF